MKLSLAVTCHQVETAALVGCQGFRWIKDDESCVLSLSEGQGLQ